MKNFSMPEHVSATLELDELTRLRRSLEAAVSKEETEEILSELSLPVNSTPEVRAEWADKLSARLESRFDEHTVRPCLKIGGMPNGERFFRQSRQIFAGGLTPGKKI